MVAISHFQKAYQYFISLVIKSVIAFACTGVAYIFDTGVCLDVCRLLLRYFIGFILLGFEEMFHFSQYL
jgi:small-conductance mechanosensitive channel